MVATLARYGTNSYQVNNQRSFDAWGNIRLGAGTSDPKNRYCGNLGHQQDDESGLIYMRARYYDAGSWRFISEDPSKEGTNWFRFVVNSPVNKVDRDGKDASDDNDKKLLFANILIVLGWAMMVIGSGLCIGNFIRGIFKMIADFRKLGGGFSIPDIWGTVLLLTDYIKISMEEPGVPRSSVNGMAGGAIVALAGYEMMLKGYLLLTEVDDDCGKSIF